MRSENVADPRPLRARLSLAIVPALRVGASQLGGWVTAQLNPYLTPSTEPALHRMIMSAMAVDVLLMMLPFVPGPRSVSPFW